MTGHDIPKSLRQVLDERKRQDKKWGEQNHNDLYWLGILIEEVGELAKALIEMPTEAQGTISGLDYHEREVEINRELTQVTAVGLAWVECRERNKLP